MQIHSWGRASCNSETRKGFVEFLDAKSLTFPKYDLFFLRFYCVLLWHFLSSIFPLYFSSPHTSLRHFPALGNLLWQEKCNSGSQQWSKPHRYCGSKEINYISWDPLQWSMVWYGWHCCYSSSEPGWSKVLKNRQKFKGELEHVYPYHLINCLNSNSKHTDWQELELY